VLSEGIMPGLRRTWAWIEGSTIAAVLSVALLAYYVVATSSAMFEVLAVQPQGNTGV